MNAKIPDKNVKLFLKLMLGLVLFVILIIVIGLSRKKPTSSYIEPTWTVAQSTGLYANADSFDANMVGTLKVGDTLTLPSGVSSLTCKTISEPGVTPATLCLFYSTRLKKYGWVLQQWVD